MLCNKVLNSVGGDGTCTHCVIELNSGELNFCLSSSCDVILHYIKNYYTKMVYFLNIFTFTLHHCMVLFQVAVVSALPHIFVCLPC